MSTPRSLPASMMLLMVVMTAATTSVDCHTYYGTPSVLPGGRLKMQTYVTLDSSSKDPVEVGVEMTALVGQGEPLFDSLPTEPSDGTWDIVDSDGNIIHYVNGHEFELDFKNNVRDKIPFTHVVANYNPLGHVPLGVYDVPHIDFHFYTISKADRVKVAQPSPTEECCLVLPPTPPQGPPFGPVCDVDNPAQVSPISCSEDDPNLKYVTCDDYRAYFDGGLAVDQQPPVNPPGGVLFVEVNAAEPAMGSHLVNVLSPELTGAKPFDYTWIFGKQSCNMSFWEPMITLEYFEKLWEGNGDSGPFPIYPPTHVPDASVLYPTEYDMTYEGKNTFRVTLLNFVQLQQSNGVCSPSPFCAT